MKYIAARTIIAHTGSEEWFGAKYNMNLYRGCVHGCIYCDSRSRCYQIEDFDRIAAKRDALNIIKRELRSKRKTGVVGTGSMSDPYNPLEAKYELTRGALGFIDSYGFGVSITTKGSLVARDIDLLSRIRLHSPVCVGITITAAEDSLSRAIEPAAPLSSQRFAAISELTENGLYAGVVMTPILPFVTDSEDNVRRLVEKAAASGARFVFPWFGVTLRLGQREYFYDALQRLYPGLKERYQDTYGSSYNCPSPNHRRLRKVFACACLERGIEYRMQGIIDGARNNVQVKQVSLF